MVDTATIQDYATSVANQNGLDPSVFLALLHQESGFNPDAVSSKGAVGLGQLMPGTAAQYGVTNPFDWKQNINGSAAYLKDLLSRFGGNYSQALAAYNAGPGTVDKVLQGIGSLPTETQNYLSSIAKYLNLNDLFNIDPSFGPNGTGAGLKPAGNNPLSAFFNFIANLFSINTAVRLVAILAGLILITAAVVVIAGGTKYVKEIGSAATKAALAA